MVLQVLPDAGQMMHGRDAVFRQRLAVADAGEHQELRRLERAGGYDHFAAGANLLPLMALDVLDPDRALALEQDSGGMRERFDTQIRARGDMRMHIGTRRAPALAVFLRHLVNAEAFMVLVIEVLAEAELRFLRSLQENLLHRIVGAPSVDVER